MLIEARALTRALAASPRNTYTTKKHNGNGCTTKKTKSFRDSVTRRLSSGFHQDRALVSCGPEPRVHFGFCCGAGRAPLC